MEHETAQDVLLLNNYLMCAYDVPGTVLGTWNTLLKKTDKDCYVRAA